jgi:hypothetical protein
MIGLRIILRHCGQNHPPRKKVRWDIREVGTNTKTATKEKATLLL